MSHELRGLIRAPSTYEPLDWSDSHATGLQSAIRFAVESGIPVMVPPNKQAGAAIHKLHQAEFYDNEDPEFEITRPHGTPAFYEWLLGEKYRRSVVSLGDLTGKTVLTVCGGSGMDAEYLARAGARVIASDISLGAATRTRARARRFGFGVFPIVADVEHLPFADQSVDYVYVHDGLHHLEDPSIGLREMARVARLGVSVTEPCDAAVTGLAVRLQLAEAVEDAGNRVERLQADRVADIMRAAGLTSTHIDRYAMYYRHRPGPVMSLLSLPVVRPLASLAFVLVNRLIGRYGNKLTVQGVRRTAS